MHNIFENGDHYTRQQVLRILGSNLILSDQKIKIEAKDAFIFFKQLQNEATGEKVWLEPENMPKIQLNWATLPAKFTTVPRRGLEPPRIY